MLKVEQRGWAWTGLASYVVTDDGRQVTELVQTPDIAGWADKGASCMIDGVPFWMTHPDRTSYTFFSPTRLIATAERRGPDRAVVSAPPAEFRLVAAGFWTRTWQLLHQGRQIGSCRVGMWSGTGDLPADFPTPLRVFVLYVVMTHGEGVSRRGSGGRSGSWP